MQCNMLAEESEQKQYQAVTSDKERVELELREVISKLEVQLASSLEHAQQLELDLKTSEETATKRMEELAKVKMDLELESNRALKAEADQEQSIRDLQGGKAILLALVEALELRLKALQEEVEGYLVKIEDLRQEKEASDAEILALKDELSKVKLLSEENSSVLLETISCLKTEISKLEVHLADRSEELQSFEKEQAGWLMEKAAFLEQINQATQEKEELKSTISMWIERMEKLEMEHTTPKTTSREVESSLLLHQNEHSRVLSELSEKAERMLWLEEELKRLQAELLGSQEAADQLSTELKRVSEELKDRLLADQRIEQFENTEQDFTTHSLNEQKAMDLLVQLGALSQEKEGMSAELQAFIHRLEEDLPLVQESEQQLRKLLDGKVQEIVQLEEQLDRLKAARLVFQEEHKQNTERLEMELKRLEAVIIGLRDEKIAVSEQHALTLGRCNDLEAVCKSLQKQLADQHAERIRLEAQLSLNKELRNEAIDDEEMVRVMQERVSSKQHEIDQVQSINEDLKEIMRKFESEVDSLKDQIIILQKKNTSLNEEVSTKASLVQELEHNFTSLKEEKVVFEGGLALAVGNVTLVQAEVDKLLEKISKLNDLSITTGENLPTMEDRISNLQVSNLNLRDEISGLAKKEKSYVIAVRFMRAEFFCLVQRIKAMKEEKVELERSAELAIEAERKKNGEVLSGLHQELAFLREENKRQRTIIFDQAEEKREAIRQLCATLDYMQAKNRRLEGVIKFVRDKIQRRIAASSSRRS